MKRESFSGVIVVLLLSASAIGQLKVVQVGAPAINCIFDPTCRVTVSDTVATIPITADGKGFLQSRTFTGSPGAPANGLYAYDFRIDLTNTRTFWRTCIRSLTIAFGPAVHIFDYNGDGSPDQVYVVTQGGIGTIGLSSASQDPQGNISFTFSSPVCSGFFFGRGASTYFFGLTSTQPPQAITATVTGTAGGRYNIAVRAPQPAPPCSIPPYDPFYWNDNGTVQWNNNCYNYANNKRTDTFAQPGRAAGAQYSMPITCTGAHNAAVADGLQVLPASGSCPAGKDKVALVVAPCVAPGCAPPFYSGNDFHWYRLGIDGMWTHKPGGTPATNVDQSGHTITNPQTANRCGPGLCYSDFCGYFCSCSDAEQGQGHENVK